MTETYALEPLDRKVVAALLAHPRCRVSALATAVGTSAPTVSRRLAELFQQQLIRVVSVVDQQHVGYGFAVLLRLRCVPGASADVAQAVAQWPESGYVSVVGGDLGRVAKPIAESLRGRAQRGSSGQSYPFVQRSRATA